MKALIRTAKEHDYELEILEAVHRVNEKQKRVLVAKILSHFNNDVKGKTFTLWGLSFKPRTNDMREAPSLAIINELHRLGAKIKAHDPVALNEARRLGLDKKVELFEDNYAALDGSDGLILVTEWLDYREPDFDLIKEKLRTPVIFDGRNIYHPQKLKAKGFYYYGIGRR